MKGWFVANGDGGTPDAIYKFIQMFGSSGGTGGSNNAVVIEHNHGITDPTHAHNIRRSGATPPSAWTLNTGEIESNYTNYATEGAPTGISVNNEGVDGTGLNMPKFINAIPIIRMS